MLAFRSAPITLGLHLLMGAKAIDSILLEMQLNTGTQVFGHW